MGLTAKRTGKFQGLLRKIDNENEAVKKAENRTKKEVKNK